MNIKFDYNRYQQLHWINNEIPEWLNKFSNFESFDKAMLEACASPLWKVIAYGMAKERWDIKHIENIPG